MENTCRKDCHLWKKYKKDCPNYIESWWTPEGKGDPVLMEDCAPKRNFLMNQELYNRVIALQKSNEEQRNLTDSVIIFLRQVAEGSAVVGKRIDVIE